MGVRIETALGTVEGTQAAGHQSFLGVPFAKPPVGELRFLPPQPAEPWSGVREATAFGASCPQGEHPVPGMAASGPRDEDCLYLNVYTPASDGGSRPVLFWIHGGGFTLGSGSEALYNGGPLAERGDVVVVSIHYRLGALGYLHLGGHGGDEWGATANAGQLDQVAALEWVRDNIAAFGGDPSSVTIFGESAGSVAVGTLLAMPAASGLFHRAVLQSGTPFRTAGAEAAGRLTAAFLGELGLERADRERLQAAPVEAILAAQVAAPAKVHGAAAAGFAPVCDSTTLPERPMDVVRAGGAAAIPVIAGTNRDEVKLFNTPSRNAPPLEDADLATQVAETLGDGHAGRVGEVIEVYRRSRAGLGLSTANRDLRDAIQTDARFRVPAARFAEAQSAHQPSTYSYLFTWESPARGGVMGSCHALEMPFVFGTLDAPTQDRFAGTGPEAERLAANMMDAWVAFARGGDPSHAGIDAWTPYDSESRSTMVLGRTSEAQDAPFEEERAVWDGIIP